VDADDEQQQHQQLMLTDENRRLNEAKTCRVCEVKDVDTVLVPCGHLVSCDRCSPQLRSCPVCETHIRATVNSRQFSHKLNELSTIG